MQTYKKPAILTCKSCRKTLPKAVICENCFRQSAVLPFEEFKALNLEKIEKAKIVDPQLPPQAIEKAKAIAKLQSRRKRIELYKKFIEQKKERIDYQMDSIRECQNSLRTTQRRNTQLRGLIKGLQEKATEFQINNERKVNQMLSIKQKNQRIKQELFKDIFQLTQVPYYPLPEIKKSCFSIPTLQGEVETIVSAQSIEVVIKQTSIEKAKMIIFVLQQFFRRISLLATILNIRLPYRMAIKGRNQMAIGMKKIFSYFDLQLIQQVRSNFKRLIPPDRKKKQGFYIDQQALNLLQANLEVFLARIGQPSIQGRILCITKQDFTGFFSKDNNFASNQKAWNSNLLTSRLNIIAEEQKIENSQDQVQFQSLNMIDVHEITSIHSSSEDLQDL